jgi:hypothetical protein
MERAVLLKELEAAKRRVAKGIATMSAAGIDTREVEAIFQNLENTRAFILLRCRA